MSKEVSVKGSANPLVGGSFEVRERSNVICYVEIDFRSMTSSTYEILDKNGNPLHRGTVEIPDGCESSYRQAMQWVLSKYFNDEVIIKEFVMN